MPDSPSLSSHLIELLTTRGQTIAVAESLTGGLLAAELIQVPGASAVVLGGIVAYRTELKHTLLGVDRDLLEARGAVDPDVAAHMATGVRDALAVAGAPAHIGISTTGVAGPDTQDGHPVGTVYLGFAIGDEVTTKSLQLTGSRAEIRAATVRQSLLGLSELLGTA